MITTDLLLSLLLILVAAWAMGSIFNRLGLPPMLGQLLAGLLLGPAFLGLIEPSDGIELLADLGIFFVSVTS
jgi:Kef-type K+ transport system membrane component KefB